MKLAIMQPNFFPYLGYFSLIAQTDKFVSFDATQYPRHKWTNRNRVLHPKSDQGWQYIGLPLEKHNRSANINDIRVSGDAWKEKIIRQLAHYQKIAKYFESTVSLLNESFSTKEKNLAKLNLRFLSIVCRKLDLDFDFLVFSELDLDIQPQKPGDWALMISKKLGARKYINPPAGESIFDKEEFSGAGVELGFIKNLLNPYEQGGRGFIDGLSIIDVLMFNDVGQVRKLINQCEVYS